MNCQRCKYGNIYEAGSFSIANGSAWQMEYECKYCNWIGAFKNFEKKQPLKLQLGFEEDEEEEMEKENVIKMKDEVAQYKAWNNIWHDWVKEQHKGGPVRCHTCAKKAFYAGNLTEANAKNFETMELIGKPKEFKEKVNRFSLQPNFLVEFNYRCTRIWDNPDGTKTACGAKHTLQVSKPDFEQHFNKKK